MITNFDWRIFVIMLNTSLKSCTQLNIGRLQFDCSMICIVLFFNYFIQLINLNFFWYCIPMLVNLFFKLLTNLSGTTDFPLLWLEYISIVPSCIPSLIHCKVHNPDLLISCLIDDQTYSKNFEKQWWLQYLFCQWNNPGVVAVNINGT